MHVLRIGKKYKESTHHTRNEKLEPRYYRIIPIFRYPICSHILTKIYKM